MLENSNPAVFRTVSDRKVLPEEEDDDIRDEIDAREVFDILFWHIPSWALNIIIIILLYLLVWCVLLPVCHV